MTLARTLSCCFLVFALSLHCCLAADRILFDRLGPTQAALFISNADGSVERPLTRPGSLDYNPSWAPKGDWIVFTSERDGSADLFRVHPDGTSLERLTDDPAYDDQAAFSPDGARIVFVSTRAGGRANLWILDAAGHKASALTTGNGGDFRPSWSPDAAWIAFSSDRDSDLPDHLLWRCDVQGDHCLRDAADGAAMVSGFDADCVFRCFVREAIQAFPCACKRRLATGSGR